MEIFFSTWKPGLGKGPASTPQKTTQKANLVSVIKVCSAENDENVLWKIKSPQIENVKNYSFVMEISQAMLLLMFTM